MTISLWMEWAPFLRAAGPLLLVAGPIVMAAIVAAIRPPRLALAVAFAATLAVAVLAAAVGNVLLVTGAGFERAAGFMTLILAGLALLTGLSATSLIGEDSDADIAGSVAALLLLMQAGLFGAALMASDPLSMVVLMEATALCAVALTATLAKRDAAALPTALAALCVFALGGALLAAGGVLTDGSRALAFGGALMLVGLLTKSGVAPFHGPVIGMTATGGFAGGLLIGPGLALAAIFVAARWLHEAPAPLHSALALAFASVAGFGAVFSAVQAAGAVDFRRFASFSITAQIACVLIGFAVSTPMGVAAGLMHAVSTSALAAGLLFASAAIAPAAGKRASMAHLDGLARRRPLAALTIAVSVLSVVGAPLTVGFLSKWLLIQAALAQGWWPAAAAIIISSLAGVVAAGAVIERLFFTPSDPDQDVPHLSSVALAPVLAVSLLTTVVLGVSASTATAWAEYAASALVGGR